MDDPIVFDNKIIKTDTSQNYTYHAIILITILVIICFSSMSFNSAIIGGALLSQSRYVANDKCTRRVDSKTPGSCLKSFSVVPFKKRKNVSFNMRKNKTCLFKKQDKPADIKKNSVKYRNR